MRRYAIYNSLTFALFILATALPCLAEVTSNTASQVHPDNVPLTVNLSSGGGMNPNASWNLSVNSAGQAELVSWKYPSMVRKSMVISPQQLEELQTVLETEDFFRMQPHYGELVPDGGQSTLTVVKGSPFEARTHTVSLRFFGNWILYNPQKLVEPARAIRVFRVVYKWIGDVVPGGNEPYGQRVLEAVEKWQTTQR